jgi:hypothetical protein
MTGAAAVAVVPSTTTMSLSVGFTSPTGATPQTTNSPTFTVPSGNAGQGALTITGTGAANVSFSDNGGAFSAVSNGDAPIYTDTHTGQFKLTGAARAATITILDIATSQVFAGPFTITNT